MRGGGAAKPDAMPVAPYSETFFDTVRISSNDTAGSHTFTYLVDNELAGGTCRVSAVFCAFGD